jgi:hypothetical protein
VPEQQAQNLAARVAAGTGNRHADLIGHFADSAWLCEWMQIHAPVGFVTSVTRAPRDEPPPDLRNRYRRRYRVRKSPIGPRAT